MKVILFISLIVVAALAGQEEEYRETLKKSYEERFADILQKIDPEGKRVFTVEQYRVLLGYILIGKDNYNGNNLATNL